MKNYQTTNQIPAENKESLLQKINPVRNSPPIGPLGGQSTGVISNGINFLRLIRWLFQSRRRVAAMVAVALIVLGGYIVYEKYFHLTPAEKAQKELAAAVAGVSKLIILPQGDEPVLATVTDAKTLIAQQAFFAGSENGDQLLLFPRNLKAVLWSPSRNVIVNVGPIEQQQSAVTNQQPASNSPQPTAGPPTGQADANTAVQNTILTLEVRNGTGKTGYASTAADQIRANAGYSVVKVADAAKKDYPKTVVFSRAKNDNQKQLVNELAAAFKADIIFDFPSGEKNTEADALVILGDNEQLP